MVFCQDLQWVLSQYRTHITYCTTHYVVNRSPRSVLKQNKVACHLGLPVQQVMVRSRAVPSETTPSILVQF